jgi:ketosteroid isomerase-like protein
MRPNLPPAVARFVDASNARDLEGFVACFAADAVVEDEGRTHTGADEVRAWKQATENRSSYTIDPTKLEQRDGQTILSATLAGNFPGTPVDLTYDLTIGADDAITALTIHP